jgi:PD-(D/E)XK endonuclease
MTRPGSGNAGEAALLAALVRRGLSVLVPFGEGLPYDLAVDLGTRALLRVQCKTAWPVGGCLIFNCMATDHGRGPRSYLGRADIFGVYFPPTRAIYLVPIAAVAESEGRLRLEPTRNNQKRGIRFAADFEIDRWTVDSLREIVRPGGADNEAALSVA